MIIFDKDTKTLDVPVGLGNLEINIVSGSTPAAAGVNSINGQQGDLTLKTVNGNQLLGSGDIVISENPEEIITSAVTVANEYTDTVTSGIAANVETLSAATSGVDIGLQTLSGVTSGISSDLQTLQTSAVTSTSIHIIWTGTQAQYDAITTKDPNTLYFINNN